MTYRLKWANTWGPPETSTRIRTSETYWLKPYNWNSGAKGKFLTTGEPTRVFCASLADVFELNRELIQWRRELFNLIAETPYLTWLILTKRIDIAYHWIKDNPWILPLNIRIGTSVENQQTVNERLPWLQDIPFSNFVSIEPLLEPIEIMEWATTVNWLIIGGESGPNARPFHIEWAIDLIEQAGSIPVFMKQVGSNAWYKGKRFHTRHKKGGDMSEWPEEIRVREFYR